MIMSNIPISFFPPNQTNLPVPFQPNVIQVRQEGRVDASRAANLGNSSRGKPVKLLILHCLASTPHYFPFPPPG
jgi:hypothetical protein